MRRFFSNTATAMSKRIAFTVQGEVQGVFFRQFTEQTAKQLGVTGWVKNENTGNVSGEAQGPEDKLKDFVKQLQKGPRHASVSSVDTQDIAGKEGESGFSTKG